MSLSDNAGPDWGALAHRGQLTMDVLTLARAAIDGMPLRPDTGIVSVVYPDGGDPFALAFVSAEKLAEFVAYMEPRTLTVKVGPLESEAPLRAMLARVHEGIALH